MKTVPDWHLNVTHMMACNCNYGCPCAFNAPPTTGACEGVVAVRVEEGTFGDLPLAGHVWAAALTWPGAIHERDGRGVVFLDESVDGEEREALEALATGRAGGPWSILMGTVTAGLEVRQVPLVYEAAGVDSRLEVPGAVNVTYQPIRNPVTGAEHKASVLLPTGMLTTRQDHYASKTMRVEVDGIRFDYSGRSAAEMKGDWRGP